MNYNSLTKAVTILFKKGVRHCVISPGSRSAPLTIAFARHEGIEKIVVPDERSAAFIGLGIALKATKPVVLICTSGSAVLNYAPAVAEAFYQGTPLLVLTADRPPEWIGQQDGQTIQQDHVFGKHIKASFDFPGLDPHGDAVTHSERIINQAYNIAVNKLNGPVHINFPFREPFYPDKGEVFDFNESVRVIDELSDSAQLTARDLNNLSKEFQKYSKILLVMGQSQSNPKLTDTIVEFSDQLNIPVCADITGNFPVFSNLVRHHDLALFSDSGELVPELVITLGKSILSKKLKTALRKNEQLAHWHVGENGEAADIFQHLTKHVICDPKYVFEGLSKTELQKNEGFLTAWLKAESKIQSEVAAVFKGNTSFTEFSAIEKINRHLPEEIDLHLSNSMTVRYFNLLGVNNKNIEVYCNRGVSGIDGSTGTAVGSAIVSGKLTVLVTGDLAFFYDRNSLWHQHLPANLRIIVMNNNGGGIFGLIPGPSSQPELEQYFETPHTLDAKNTAADFGLAYTSCESFDELNTELDSFFSESGSAKIMEIKTDKAINKNFYESFIKGFKKNDA